MFELRITSLHEFRMFVKLIKGQDVTDEEIKKLSDELNQSSDKLIEAEKKQGV